MHILKATTSFLALAVSITACSTAASSTRSERARAGGTLVEAREEIQPLFERMLATANAHDVDGHLAAYVRDSTLVFVINDEIIRGWTELHERQRQWWQDGKSDAAYRVVGEPAYQMPALGVVVQTYLLSSHRTLADGAPSDGRIAVTDIWRKGPDGWRVVYAHESFGQR